MKPAKFFYAKSRMARNKGEVRMNIIHIMADGTQRESIEGVVITSDQFYQVANGILEKGRA